MFSLKKIFPGMPETERGRPFVLKADPKGEKLIYGIANSVIIRSLSKPDDAEIITNHQKKVTCAAYAPSGFYVASGDAGGTLKIWDTTNDERSVKYEYKLMSADITDICWSDDSKRIACSGVGRETFGCVVSWDTGTNVGAITRHTKNCLTIDFKQARPYAIMTAGEDFTIIHHTGPPFKFEKRHETHSNFVNCVRYNKDGSFAASAGQDGKIFVYDGKTCDLLHELVAEGKSKAHDGGVYSISWSPCGTKLLSASGDKSCKIWNVADKKCETVFIMGKDVMDQQLGSLWVDNHILSLSLSGKITFLDVSNPTNLSRCYWGHNKGIVSAGISKDKKQILTGSYEGHLNIWNAETGECHKFEGPQFTSQISAFSIFEDSITAVGVGKVVKFATLSKKAFDSEVFKTETEPLCVAMIDSQTSVIGCIGYLYLMKNKAQTDVVKLPYDAISLAFFDNNKKVAVAGSDKKVRIYAIEGNKLVVQKEEISFGHPISCISITHNQKKLLICAATRYAHQYDLETLKEEIAWLAQGNRVNCGVFSDNDEYIATSGVDGAIVILKTGDKNYRIENRLAHRMYNCSYIVWMSENTIASFGQQDCTIKIWELKF